MFLAEIICLMVKIESLTEPPQQKIHEYMAINFNLTILGINLYQSY